MATNNDIKYISFTFENEEQSDISPNDVEVEIIALDKYKIAEYKFNNTLYDLIPEFNAEFTNYTYEDVVEGEVTTRTIYSNSLPTEMYFGDHIENIGNDKSNSLLELIYANTSSLVTMKKMFSCCENMYICNTNNFETQNVTDMYCTFAACTKLTSLDVSNFDTSNVTNMFGMFANCIELEELVGLNSPGFNTEKVANMGNMFVNCKKISTLQIENFKTSKVANMQFMFSGCNQLTSLDVSNFDTCNVTNMKYMFKGCLNLTSIGDISNWDVSNVTNMEMMFRDCNNLTFIDLSNFDTRNTTDMDCLFYSCDNLTNINISNWDLNNITDFTEVFYETPYLRSITMNNSDYNSVNKIIAQLPTRTEDSIGTLDITGIDDISQVDTTTAESKFWNIKNKIKIAEYKFDKSIHENLIPEFNEGFTYTYEDSSIMDGFVTRKLYAAENDFVDISKCISRNKGTYNAGIYAGTNIMVSAPMFLDNEILFRGYEWDSLNIDLSDYQGKEINISFTIEHFANQWSELNIGIELYDDTDLDGYSRVTYEDCLSENLIKEYSVTWTIPNEKCRLYLGGMYLELSNINIMIEDYNLFPNHILTEYDYINSIDFKVNKPSLYDNKLAFSHYWNAFNIECEQFKGKEATISFDIEEIDNGYGFSECEINIPQTVEVPLNDHYSNTFIIESDHIYIGGNGIKITNLQILVDNRTTEETISNLPTLMRFGTETASNSALSLLEVDYLDTGNVTTMEMMFCNCNNLQQLDTYGWNTSNVTDMSYMFTDCPNLTTLDVSNFDTNSVTDMSWMFYKCQSLTQLDVSKWDTSNVTTMMCMFSTCHSLASLDVSKWVTSNVISMESMFSYDYMLTTLDVSNWNIGKVVTIFNIFGSCQSLTQLNVSNWDTSNVENMGYMFYNCNNLTTLDVSNWNTKNVTDMSFMFYNCNNLTTLDVSNWNTKNVTDMSFMFNDCYMLTSIGNLSNWNVGNVTDMHDMFWKCESLTSLDVTNWDTSNVTDMHDIFCRCYELNSIIGIENWDVSNVTNMLDMFYGCKISELDLSNWDTGKVTDMSFMFSDCYMLQTLNVTGWDTSNVTNMDEMFSFCEIGCRNLRNIIGLNTWDTSNVTNMYCMFWECRSLESLDLSNWDTRNVTDMSWMFCDCESLETLNLDGWYINENPKYNDLFSPYEYDGCKSLTSISMNNSDYNSVNKIISELPTRTTDSMGTLNIAGIDDISQVNITTAESKFWNVENRIKIKVVEYKFTNSSDLVPAFNEGFVYTYEDIVDGAITTKTIYSTELPTKISFNGATRLLEVLYLDSSNIIDASNMFYGCTKLTNIVGIKDWDVRKITTMYMMFTSCKSLTELDLSNWEPSSLTTMYGMFYKCSKITSIKLGKGNTPVLTSTEGMFNSCMELLTIDFGGLNTSNVNNMGGTFSDCRKLKSLDISHWDVSKVTNFGAIFRRCNSLLELNLRNWDLSSADNITTMFESCSSIVTLELSDLVVDKVESLSGVFQMCSNLTTLNLNGWHLKEDVSITNLFNKCDKLKNVNMERSDAFTVNKFIEALPTRSKNNKGFINIKHVVDFSDVNIKEAISKYWNVFRNQGNITDIYLGFDNVVKKLLQNKKIKNIYLGNSKKL